TEEGGSMRPGRESNSRIALLQRAALPLGYQAGEVNQFLVG
ncbi:MAG: hypothetical protein UV40_C0031G0011, partial [Parcubacteria group bacterium GW2011_GWA1_42_7]